MNAFVVMMSVVSSVGSFSVAHAEGTADAIPIEKKPFVFKASPYDDDSQLTKYSKATDAGREFIAKTLEEDPGCVVSGLEAASREFKALASSPEIVALKDKTEHAVTLQKLAVGYTATRPSAADRTDLVEADVTASWVVSFPLMPASKSGFMCFELIKADAGYSTCTQLNDNEVEVKVSLGRFSVGTNSGGMCSPVLTTELRSEVNKVGEESERLMCEDVGLSLCFPGTFTRRVLEAKASLDAAATHANRSIEGYIALEKKMQADLEEKERIRVKEELNRQRLRREREEQDLKTRKVLDEVGAIEMGAADQRAI